MECCKLILRGHFNRNAVASIAVKIVEVWRKRFQGGTIMTNELENIHDIFLQNCGCILQLSQSLPVAKFESNRMISLAQDISRQPKIDSALQELTVTLMQIYNEKNVGSRQINNWYSWERKEHNVKGRLVLEGMLELLRELFSLRGGLICTGIMFPQRKTLPRYSSNL